MNLRLQDLCPYQSLILARASRETDRDLFGRVFSRLIDALELDDRKRRRIAEAPELRVNGLSVAALHYLVLKRPAWTLDDGIEDHINHIAVLFRSGRDFAVHLSEASIRGKVAAHLDNPGETGLGELEPIPASFLNAAFVNGPARTVWMSGIHGRTTLKPDSKVLVGLDLRDALDPLADQTYYMTAARSRVRSRVLTSPLGVAPRSSRIWIGASKDWTACTSAVSESLKILSTVHRGNDAPLPYVAFPSERIDALGEPYEIAIVPPQLLADDSSVMPEQLQDLEAWSEKTEFRNVLRGPNGIEAQVLFDKEELGTIRIGLQPLKHGRVGVNAVSSSASPRMAELVRHVRNDQWLRIWFDSGDTLSGDGVYRVHFRDFPADDLFGWHSFSGFDVTREKPGDPIRPEEIGKHDSLFCWTLKHWPPDSPHTGWLACDDGAMELADFIHLDDGTLTLIHAKGSNSGSPSRCISVSSYEVVVSQAVKSLRWLDTAYLAEGLKQGLAKQVGKAVWRGGKKSERELLLKRLESLGSDYRRRVVILQPQVTSTALDRARRSTDPRERARYRQLMTLLHSAAASCRALGAGMTVIGQQIAVRAAGG